MKQVYVCDFCPTFGESVSIMEEHENSCSFNPVNKGCYSCKNRKNFYGSISCEVKHPNFERSGNVNCDKWEARK